MRPLSKTTKAANPFIVYPLSFILFTTLFLICGFTRGDMPLQIRTVPTQAGEAVGLAGERLWTVRFSADANGRDLIEFYEASSQEPYCAISISDAGSFQWVGKPRHELINHPDLLVSPGHPAPCHLLPVKRLIAAEDSEMAVTATSRAGKTEFAHRLKITCHTVTPADARARGWLDESVGSVSGPLYMVSVTRADTGRLVVKQLWPASGGWWLYQETRLRRSWQIG